MIRLSGAIQEALLSVCAFDAEGGSVIESILTAGDFDLLYEDFYKAISDYRVEFKAPPGEHLLDLAERIRKSKPKQKEQVVALYQSILSTKGEINRDYVLKQARTFARYQGMRKALALGLEGLEKGDEAGLLETETILAEAVKNAGERGKEDGGIFLHDTSRSLRFLDERSQPFLTGIREFDERGLGLARQRILIFAAPPKAGKSWFLIHLAKMSHLQALRVLYITLELSEAEVAGRLVQSFFAVQKRKIPAFKTKLIRDPQTGRMIDLQIKELPARLSFQDHNIRKKLITKMAGLKQRPRLMIHQFPTGGLTVPELNVLLDSLEHRHHFIPDVLLVDYPDLMRTKTKHDQHRHALGEIFQDLRGIAIKRDIAVGAVTQANRASRGAQLVTDVHIAEDYSKVATADLVLTYSQTSQERELGLARLFVAAGRTDVDKFAVLITQNYATGQFVQDSAMLAPNYWSLVEDRAPSSDAAADEDEED